MSATQSPSTSVSIGSHSLRGTASAKAHAAKDPSSRDGGESSGSVSSVGSGSGRNKSRKKPSSEGGGGDTKLSTSAVTSASTASAVTSAISTSTASQAVPPSSTVTVAASSSVSASAVTSVLSSITAAGTITVVTGSSLSTTANVDQSQKQQNQPAQTDQSQQQSPTLVLQTQSQSLLQSTQQTDSVAAVTSKSNQSGQSPVLSASDADDDSDDAHRNLNADRSNRAFKSASSSPTDKVIVTSAANDLLNLTDGLNSAAMTVADDHLHATGETFTERSRASSTSSVEDWDVAKQIANKSVSDDQLIGGDKTLIVEVDSEQEIVRKEDKQMDKTGVGMIEKRYDDMNDAQKVTFLLQKIDELDLNRRDSD